MVVNVLFWSRFLQNFVCLEQAEKDFPRFVELNLLNTTIVVIFINSSTFTALRCIVFFIRINFLISNIVLPC